MGWGPGATCHTRAGDPGPRDTHCPPPERSARSLPPCALLVLEQFTSKMCGRKHACFFLSPAPTMTGPFPLRQWLQDGARLHGDQTAWGDIGVPMRRASRPALENTKSVSTWAVSSPTSQGMPPAGELSSRSRRPGSTGGNATRASQPAGRVPGSPPLRVSAHTSALPN